MGEDNADELLLRIRNETVEELVKVLLICLVASALAVFCFAAIWMGGPGGEDTLPSWIAPALLAAAFLWALWRMWRVVTRAIGKAGIIRRLQVEILPFQMLYPEEQIVIVGKEIP